MAAVESLGFWLPGEPFALNSYENRVYHLADDDRRRWVAKFYRPERWSRAQILEEHAFLAELDEAGVPGAPRGPTKPARRCIDSKASTSLFRM